MASIIAKKRGKKSYYYVATSARVDGKPRIVRQTYLGTAERIEKLFRSKAAPVPLDASLVEFGLPAALWVAALRSGALDALRSVWPDSSKGPSTARYLLLAAFHRICSPGPKTQAAEWYASSVLRRLWQFPPERFSSQAFRDCFDAIEVGEERDGRPANDELERAQGALLAAFRGSEAVGERVVAYDTTNFHTWIASANERCDLPARGRSKQKRNDLRQVGLSYALDADCGLALCHHVYRGNVADSAELPAALERIERMLEGAGIDPGTVTLVMDKGSAALENTLELEARGLGWVAALPWNQVPEEVRGQGLEEAERLGPGASALTKRALVHGERRLCVTRHSESFACEQLHSFSTSLAKAVQRLKELAKAAGRPGSRHTEQGLRKKIEGWLRPNRVGDAVSWELERDGDRWRLSFQTDYGVLQRLMEQRFGRTVLVTNRMQWTGRQVVEAYQRQERVEQVFRGLKGGGWLCWGPMHHWTDSKIRVHAFYCLLGVSLLQWLRREAAQAWTDISIEQLRKELGAIQQFDLLYPGPEGKGRPRLVTVSSRASFAQQRLAEQLGLDELLETASG